MSRNSCSRRGVYSAPVPASDHPDDPPTDPASLHALDIAYHNLKKRYNELSKTNSDLMKQLKRGSSSLDESVLSSFHSSSSLPTIKPPPCDLQKQLQDQQRVNADLEHFNEEIMKENVMLKKRLSASEVESADVKMQNELLKEKLLEVQNHGSLLAEGEEGDLIAGLQQLLQVVAQQRAEMSALRQLAERQKSAIQQLLLSPSNRDSPMMSIPLQCTDMEMDIASMCTMLNDPSLVCQRPSSTRPKSAQISPPRPSVPRSSHTAPITDHTLSKHFEATLPPNNSHSRVAIEHTEPRPLNFDRNVNESEGQRSNHRANPNLLPPSPPAMAICVGGQKPVPSRNIFEWTPRDRAEHAERPDCPPQICPVCSTSFTPSMSVQAFQDHVNECLPSEDIIDNTDRVCPMCNEHFSEGVTDRVFHEHVDGHFNADFSIVEGSEI